MRFLRGIVLVAAAVVAVGIPSVAQAGTVAQGAADYAVTKLGCPYSFGAAGPTRFDNPGLVRAAYASVGVSLPATVAGQYSATTRLGFDQLQPGDLVFYGDQSPTSVAIYEGGGRVISAGHAGTVVAYHPYDQSPIYAFGRVA
jgi:cell wall-associated NlpC family hydrolase